MKAILTTIFLTLLTIIVCVGQDSLLTTDTLSTIHSISSNTNSVVDVIWRVLGGVLLLYELIVRAIPTAKDYSVVGVIYKLLNWLVANKGKANEVYDIVSKSKTKT